jgi:uroporphyrinogen decarboxylase
MTLRDRYLAAMLFGKPDKVPFQPGHPRESTRERWHREGLPADRDYFDFLLETLGIQPEKPKRTVTGPGISFRMNPMFEENVLEHKDGHYIVQDWMGSVTEISDQFDVSYIRNAKDFVTRKWHKFPVENRKDWDAMKWRYNPEDEIRRPHDFEERCRLLRERDYPTGIYFSGPWWQMREWLGFEPLCMMTKDDPDFIHDLCDFWAEFVSATMAPLLRNVQLDSVLISEDMAYKGFSMISPAMVREFLVPVYERWVSEIRASGCPVIEVDSDGYIGELIPIWIERGINACVPIEVAAGNDIVEFRRQFGRKMAYEGGVDKRAIAKGGKVMRDEVMRIVPPLLKEGGFIPSCDHGVPPDISWPNFVEYARLLAQLTGWL